ncbi:MAG: formylglycine-generating enzyme family protein, partial [Cyanobacteria bacterium P01_E01_bin.6]
HEVTVPSFFMGKHSVTQAQWRAVSSWPQVNQSLDPDLSHFKGANRPVENVSWHDAVEFCQRLSKQTGSLYRLPSEAEWEYACRAGTTSNFHFGSTITRDVVNCKRNLGMVLIGLLAGKTTDVGSFKVANDFGLFDMHGNVFEWCQDPWHANYQGAPIDGSVWDVEREADKRVSRGGSWSSVPELCRSAYRSYSYPVNRFNDIGFRVVCSAPRALC